MIVVKISVKNFNEAKLREELAALPIIDLGFAGFVAISSRVYAPFAEDTRIAGNTSAGGFSARRGELRIFTTRNLTAPEDTTLVSLLAAHNSTVLTAEQVRQAQDESDLDALIASDRDAFIAAIQSMQTIINGLPAGVNKDFCILTRANMITIGKMMRLFIRRERGAAI